MDQSTSAAGLRCSNSWSEIASLVPLQKPGTSAVDTTTNLQDAERAGLNEPSDNNEDETPSKRPRKVIIHDPQTPVEPVKCKLTATQKEQDAVRAVKKT